MKKKKHIQTDFIRFMIEKYIDNQGDIDTESEPIPDEEQGKKKSIKKIVELDDEIEDDEVPNDEIIDELVNEYKRLKRQNENYRILNRRK